ncbi:MAG: antibiotic biosynthesis monooxygenase [Prevotella sp.]|jgi:quinol monooxygenase YgiN|nr:antibiotic biosynthesis monooxygenase [Prevotella sp.]
MKKILLAVILGTFFLSGCMKTTEKETKTIIVKTDGEERTGDELKIVAVIKIKPEAVTDILPIFQAVVQGSQEEEGCISYNLHQDVSDPTKFIMLEEWRSQAAIDFHNNTDHYKTFKAASADMVAGMEVSIMKLVY